MRLARQRKIERGAERRRELMRRIKHPGRKAA